MSPASWLEPRGLAALAALAALLLALLRARAGVWPVRAWTLAVGGVLGAAVVGWVIAGSEPQTVRVRVVATGTVPVAIERELRATFGAQLDLIEASTDAGALAVALRGDDRIPTARTLLWLAPIDGEGVPAARVPDTTVVTGVPPLGFEPDAVTLAATGEICVGRPLALVLSGLPAGFAGSVRVGDESGAVVAEAPVADGAARLQFVPERIGPLAVTVEARRDTVHLAAAGRLVVGAAPRLLAIGPGAVPLAAALRAQGLRVDVADALAVPAPDVEVVVATGVLDEAEQERLRAFVETGGGAFLVGGEEGGALPVVAEPAAELSPVLLRERPRPKPRGDGSDRAPPPSPSPPTPPPIPPPSTPEPSAHGDTSGAKPPVGPEVDVARRTVAMVFVLDRSESMLSQASADGATRMDYVRASAQATASKLLPGDEMAVVSFGNPDAEEVVLPLTPVTAFAEVHRALVGLQARRHEGTYVHSALVRAEALLATSSAPVKHIVVITDGQIEDLLTGLECAYTLRARGATVSMIRIAADGEGARYTDLCQRFAAFGGGCYLPSNDSSEVVALVTSEVRRVLASTGRVLPQEGEPPAGADPAGRTQPEPPATGPESRPAEPPPTDPHPAEAPAEVATPESPPLVHLAVRAVEASPLLAPIPERPAPALGGALAVSARPEARVLLVVGTQGWPLLAFKNYGLGRVGAWTADLTGAWSAEWRAAEPFPAWLAQWTAALRPPSTRAAAADVLTTRTVEPRGPTPSEVARLEDYAGGALQPWQAPAVPPPGQRRVEWSLAGVLALGAAVGLLVLALLEFVVARLAARAA